MLVIYDFDHYYFNSVFCLDKNNEEVKYFSGAHIGMFQDSFIIESNALYTEVDDEFDIRYFPHSKNIEFYDEDINGREFFIENIGNCTLFCQTSKGLIKLNSRGRKKVCKENVEKENINLPDGDLYPATFIETEFDE